MPDAARNGALGGAYRIELLVKVCTKSEDLSSCTFRYLASDFVIDIRQLNALVAVADHRSFSGAADALDTVQSNISAHVRRLESDCEAILVDRARGQLTAKGEMVVARARRIQGEIESIQADLVSFDTDAAGDARLGVIGTTGRWLMPQLLRVLRAEHPRIRPIILEASTSTLVPAVLSGRLDLAIITLPVDEPELTVARLFDEDLIVVLDQGHPLAGRSHLSVADLAAEPMLLPPPGSALRLELDAAARRADVTLRPLADIDGGRLLTSLAVGGLGPAVVPTTAVPPWLPGTFVRVPLVGLPRRQVGLARRRRATPSAPVRAVATRLHALVAEQAEQQIGVHV